MSIEEEKNFKLWTLDFEHYLKSQQYRPSTIKGHLNNVERFKKWAESENINNQNISYNQLLKFIEQAQQRGVSKSSINNHLSSIKKYYDYLIKSKQRIVTLSGVEANPAKELRLKNSGKKVLQNLFTTEELENLYQQYKSKPAWEFKNKQQRKSHPRNVVILGLMVYQGLDTTELKKIETSHINLNQSNIYIPSGARNNSRILKLHAAQILPMQEYLKQHKEKLITGNATEVTASIIKWVKQINPKLTATRQIRSSVIVNWLKMYNIRQVQYMAGHKHISSTEKYKEEDLRDLQTALNLFHPLK